MRRRFHVCCLRSTADRSESRGQLGQGLLVAREVEKGEVLAVPAALVRQPLLSASQLRHLAPVLRLRLRRLLLRLPLLSAR